MTKVLPESDNAELGGLNPAHVGDHIAHGRSHSGARRPSCGDDWANIHAGPVRQMLPAMVPPSKSKGDTHEQVGFNCFCRGPRASHNWRAGHAAGGNQSMRPMARKSSRSRKAAVRVDIAAPSATAGRRPVGTGPYGVHCFRNQLPVISG